VIEIPPAGWDALRALADARRPGGGPAGIAALIGCSRPLSGDERRALLDALGRWQDERATAAARIREITARLDRP
jgi:hypothetical protein